MFSWTKKVRNRDNNEAAFALGTELEVAEWVIPRSSVTLGSKLGSGAFGTVYKCGIASDEGETPVTAVAKQINPKKLSTADLPLLKSELQNWSNITHPNCVQFLGVCLHPPEYLLLMEFMPGGSLEDVFARYRTDRRALPTESELLAMMTPVADGMCHLHSKGIIHRDLKSANILVDGERLVISDFGLSRKGESSKREFTAETGSYRWMAPEVTRHEPYDEKCDVYSYGCLGYEMASYRRPFDNMSTLEAAFAVARDGLRPELPDACPEPIAKLICDCWKQNSEERPSFELVHQRLQFISRPSRQGSSASADAPYPVSLLASGETPLPKRKIESPTAESDTASAENTQAQLKRPKSISSALVDLNM